MLRCEWLVVMVTSENGMRIVGAEALEGRFLSPCAPGRAAQGASQLHEPGLACEPRCLGVVSPERNRVGVLAE